MSATQNPGNTGIIDNHSYAVLYDRAIDAAILKQDKVALETAAFFGRRTTNLDTHVEAEVSNELDLPQRTEDTGRVPLLNPVEGKKASFTNLQYEAGVLITKRAVLAQKHALLSQMINGLPSAFARRKEYTLAAQINGGFDTATTPDGAYAFSATHYKMDPEAGTWSNLMAPAAFGPTAYEAMRLRFDTFTSEKGFVSPKEMADLIFPPALWESVMILINSEKYPRTALNDTNPFKGKFNAVKWHYATSTTAFFARAKEDEADKGLIAVYQRDTSYGPISDSMNDNILTGKMGTLIMSAGWLHARNWLGNVGA